MIYPDRIIPRIVSLVVPPNLSLENATGRSKNYRMASADELITSLQGIDRGSFTSEAERIRARDALFETLRKVQSPWDIVWEHNWVNGATHASVKTLIDAGVFTKWAESGSSPKTSAELAESTGTDELLIRTFISVCGLISSNN